MRIVLLSGGAGKRLWPLSNEWLPKQFMKIFPGESGVTVSMVQKTWRTLVDKVGGDRLYIAAPTHHETVLREQLGEDVQLILEPAARDTFPAIALACSYLSAQRFPADEAVIVLPVDAYVDPTFYELLDELAQVVVGEAASLALIGVKPAYASDKYGYIVPRPDDGQAGISVERFVEKPDPISAAALVESGALWNGGVFAFRLDYMNAFLRRGGYPYDYEELRTAYDQLPRISFDYMVVEPEKRIACVPYEGTWTDLGTWSEMIRILAPDGGSDVAMDARSQDTYVINQLGIPIIVAGIANAVVVASPEGILISDQSVSHTIKPLIDQITKTEQRS